MAGIIHGQAQKNTPKGKEDPLGVSIPATRFGGGKPPFSNAQDERADRPDVVTTWKRSTQRLFRFPALYDR
jgi:hypothetical protein